MPCALILGGSGQIGRALAARLLDDGWDVVAAHRGQKPMPADLAARGVQEVKFDRTEEGALAQALGQGVDALIDTIAFTAADAEQLLAVERHVGALVVVSSGAVYCDAQGRTLGQVRLTGWPEYAAPIDEAHTRVPPGPKDYATNKVALENALLDRARRPLTILRPGAIHGPGSPNPREWFFIKRALDRRAHVPVKWGGAHALAPSFTGNIAALIAVALAKPGLRVLNITDPDALDIMGIGQAIAGAVGHKFTFTPLGETQNMLGHTPWTMKTALPIDMSAAAALGYKPVAAYGEAVATYWRAMADELANRNGQEVLHWPNDPFDYAAEDAALANT